MADDTIETGVDSLLALLREKDRISIDEAAKILKTPSKAVQSWVDFLVEERILGLEYKFTKPYIYLNKAKQKATPKETNNTKDILAFKKEFMERAENKNLPPEKMKGLWSEHVTKALAAKKQYFIIEAKKRELDPAKTWQKYEEYLLSI
ncbi:MAG: hypothetical protein ABIA93_06305 [Candidatus Woesearchaeota archaeon]